jgi:uncharacterized membrane protein YhaH (DUF805 family)
MDYITNFDWKNADWQYLMTKTEGRINRYPFWMGMLALTVASFALQIVGSVLGMIFWPLGMLAGLAQFALIVPSFVLSTKRWHDRGKSGWWNLVVLVPLLGILYMIYETGFVEGEPGVNQYGPNPLAAGGMAAAE